LFDLFKNRGLYPFTSPVLSPSPITHPLSPTPLACLLQRNYVNAACRRLAAQQRARGSVTGAGDLGGIPRLKLTREKLVKGIFYKYCKTIHKKDGYSYGF